MEKAAVYETARKKRMGERLQEETKECTFVPVINEGAPSRRRSGVVHEALYEQGRRISKEKKKKQDKPTE